MVTTKLIEMTTPKEYQRDVEAYTRIAEFNGMGFFKEVALV